MEKYKINEFSKMLGVSVSRIRVFEKSGLLNPRRENNGYRYYTKEDAFIVNKFQTLRSLGFTISQAIERLCCSDKKAFEKALEENRNRLEKEKKLIEYRIRYIDEYSEILSKGVEKHLITRCYHENLYFLPVSKGFDFTLTDKKTKLTKTWVEYVPAVRYAMIISSESLLSGPASPESYGFVVDKSAAETFCLPIDDSVREIELGNCLSFYDLTPLDEIYGQIKPPALTHYLHDEKLSLRRYWLILPFWKSFEISPSDGEMDKYLIPFLNK